MFDDNTPMSDWLLDDQFDQLDPVERACFREKIAADENVAAQRRRLQRVLEPLDAWTAPPPPVGLVDRILDRMAASDPLAPVFKLPEPRGGESRGRSRIAMHDLIAVAAVLIFFFGMLAPSSSAIRDRSRRTQCASNLGAIGRGVSAYSMANNNALPCDPRIAGQSSFLPVAGGPSAPNVVYSPNSRGVLLLVRQGYVGSIKVLVCPSQRQVVPLNNLTLDQVNEAAQTAGQRFCGYDSLNMAGPTPKYSLISTQPYMADSNPLFADGRFNSVDPAAANSPNHRRAGGQNVLRFDASVHWTVTPNCGIRRDNIWQAGAITVYHGTEVQVSQDDTFLVP